MIITLLFSYHSICAVCTFNQGYRFVLNSGADVMAQIKDADFASTLGGIRCLGKFLSIKYLIQAVLVNCSYDVILNVIH